MFCIAHFCPIVNFDLKQNMKGFTVTSAQVVNEPVASDHRPLVIVLEQK